MSRARALAVVVALGLAPWCASGCQGKLPTCAEAAGSGCLLCPCNGWGTTQDHPEPDAGLTLGDAGFDDACVSDAGELDAGLDDAGELDGGCP